jgi:hypothetical protein
MNQNTKGRLISLTSVLIFKKASKQDYKVKLI